MFRLAETTPRYNRYKIISNNEEPASYQKKGASSRLTPHNDPMARHAWKVRHLYADHASPAVPDILYIWLSLNRVGSLTLRFASCQAISF